MKTVYKQYGEKASIAKWVVSHFPEHKVYLEPFCGSCIVLFEKPKSFVEIVNDLDGRIINMFNIIRSNPKELAAQLWATPYSSANWRDQKISEDGLEDARLLIAEGCQFYCGNRTSSTWAIDKCGKSHKPKSEVWADWFLRILPAANRLRTVQIVQEDATKAIERVYNDPGALIYVDPPYLGHEKEYAYTVDYGRMAEMLNSAKCRVIISEYPEADKFFGKWRKVEKTMAGRARTGRHNTKAKKKTEVLFMNYNEADRDDIF